MNNVVKLHDNYFDFYKNSYDKSPLDEEEARNPKQFKIIYQNGWNLKMILMKQRDWLMILKLTLMKPK